MQPGNNVKMSVLHTITDGEILNVVGTTLKYTCTKDGYTFDYPRLENVSNGDNVDTTHVTISCNGNGYSSIKS